MTAARKNLHVPLPAGLHAALRAEAQRSGRPATELAREAIDRWLTERTRALRQEAIARYAAESAGTPADLDPALLRAAEAHLRARPRARRRTRT